MQNICDPEQHQSERRMDDGKGGDGKTPPHTSAGWPLSVLETINKAWRYPTSISQILRTVVLHPCYHQNVKNCFNASGIRISATN